MRSSTQLIEKLIHEGSAIRGSTYEYGELVAAIEYLQSARDRIMNIVRKGNLKVLVGVSLSEVDNLLSTAAKKLLAAHEA